MNASKLKSVIESAFARPRKTFHRGRIIVPQRPLDLDALVLESADSEEEHGDICFDGIEGALEEHGWSCSILVAFYWQSIGPMVWQAYLQTLTHKTGLSLAFWQQEVEPCRQLIARLEPDSDGDVWQALFEKLIKENGAAFGVRIFGSLPSNTDNRAEDRIPEAAVRQAYWDWMLWVDRAGGVDWISLAEEVTARTRSPITYPLDLLKSMPGAEDLEEWLADRTNRNSRFTARAKRAIFDAYFRLSYGPY